MTNGPNPATYRPALWLPGPHLPTVWGRLGRRRDLVAYRREALETPDGDELLVDHVEPEAKAARRLVIFHGLEGSSYSTYIQGMVPLFLAAGWNVSVMNCRGCARRPGALDSHIPNRRPRLYHSGETEDPGFVLRTLRGRESGPLAALGVSLGGNALLKLLGETGREAPVDAAVSISVPYDLGAGDQALRSLMGLQYVRSFLRTLLPKVDSILDRFPEAKIDRVRARASRTFRDFDDAATAPLHGFAGADDYYARSSSLGFLPRITVPTLCLSAANDPFLPEEALERARRAAPRNVTFAITRQGGHVGFLEGTPWKLSSWAERTAVGWLSERLG